MVFYSFDSETLLWVAVYYLGRFPNPLALVRPSGPDDVLHCYPTAAGMSYRWASDQQIFLRNLPRVPRSKVSTTNVPILSPSVANGIVCDADLSMQPWLSPQICCNLKKIRNPPLTDSVVGKLKCQPGQVNASQSQFIFPDLSASPDLSSPLATRAHPAHVPGKERRSDQLCPPPPHLIFVISNFVKKKTFLAVRYKYQQIWTAELY